MKVGPLWLLFSVVEKVMTFPCESCAPLVKLRALHCYCGSIQDNFSIPLNFLDVSCFCSVSTVSLSFWLPFSFGECAFPPATSTCSFHIPFSRIMWCWNCDDSESHSGQLELQQNWALPGEDRGFRQGVMLSSGDGRLLGSLRGRQGSSGTSLFLLILAEHFLWVKFFNFLLQSSEKKLSFFFHLKKTHQNIIPQRRI